MNASYFARCCSAAVFSSGSLVELLLLEAMVLFDRGLPGLSLHRFGRELVEQDLSGIAAHLDLKRRQSFVQLFD